MLVVLWKNTVVTYFVDFMAAPPHLSHCLGIIFMYVGDFIVVAPSLGHYLGIMTIYLYFDRPAPGVRDVQ